MAQHARAPRGARACAGRSSPTRWDVDRPEDYARLQREGRLAEVLS